MKRVSTAGARREREFPPLFKTGIFDRFDHDLESFFSSVEKIEISSLILQNF